MQHFETSWQSKDGLELYIQGWEPDGKLAAVVCLVHGLGEHSGRYVHVADFLTKSGYALFAFDLRGHGRSQGPRGHSPSFEAYMEDIGLLIQEAEQRYPGRPLFLYGHSLGGLLVLNYVLWRKPHLVGVIATGAGLRSPLLDQKLKIAMARVLGSLLPSLSLSTGLDAATLSRDPDVVQAYVESPLVHDRATLGMTKNSIAAIPWVLAHAEEFSTPLLLMHGTSDRLTYPQGSQEFAQLVSCDCTLKLWEGLYHEIHNEPEQGEVFAFLLNWLESKREA